MLTKVLQEKRATVSARLVRNVLYGGLRLLLIGPVPFLLTPFIIKKVGAAGFGTWAVFLAAVNLSSLADLGLVGTISKHVSEYYAKKDFVALNRVVNTALLLFAGIAALLAAGLSLAAAVLVPVLFRGSPLSPAELTQLLKYGSCLVATNVMILLFSGIAAGLQRMDVTSVLGSFNVVLAAVLSAVALTLSMGVRGLLLANLVSAFLTLSIYICVVRTLVPMVRLRLSQFDVHECRILFSFSLQFYLTQMAVVIHNQVEKLYLGRLVNVISVGWYDIASDSATKIRSAPGLLLTPMMPAASELATKQDQRPVAELYYRAHKYLALVGVPLVAYVLVVAPRFVYLWLGPAFAVVATPLRVLVLVNFLNLTTGPGYLILVGRGILRPGMFSALTGIALNLVLSFILIYRFGFQGAVLGTTIALTVASALFIYLFHRETGYRFARLLTENYLKPLGCSVVLLWLFSFVVDWQQVGWLGMAATLIAFTIAYLLTLTMTRFFDTFDVSTVENHVPVARFVTRLIRLA